MLMATKPTDRRAAASAKPAPLLKITQKAYELASALYLAGADKAAIPIQREILGPAFLELTAKRVAVRTGVTKGRYGNPGFVRLLVQREQLVPVPNRASRKPARTKPSAPVDVPRDTAQPLTIEDIEAFARSFRELQQTLLEDRSRAIGSRIAELQRYLAISTGDDFRNTMAMANAALRELDEVEQAVNAEVVERLEPDAESPLFAVWLALNDRRRPVR
jgi:hypothetical protein